MRLYSITVPSSAHSFFGANGLQYRADGAVLSSVGRRGLGTRRGIRDLKGQHRCRSSPEQCSF